MSWEIWAIIGMAVFLVFVPAIVLFFMIKHSRKEWARKRREAVVVEGVVIFCQTYLEEYDTKRKTILEIEKKDGTIHTYKLDSSRLLKLQTAQRGDKFRMLLYEKSYDVFDFEVTQKAPLVTA